MDLPSLLAVVTEKIWGAPLLLLCIGAGVWFSTRSGFLQLRFFREMLAQLKQRASSASGLSSFQAFTIALGGRVGPGNVGGVVMGIYLGGPGAIFWMWVIAFIGSASSFVEGVLAQTYKEKVDGVYGGGPAYYIEKGLGQRWLALIFAVVAIITFGFLLSGNQAKLMSTVVHGNFGVPIWISTLFLAVLAGFVLFGGIRRVAWVSERVIPLMTLGYLLLALVVVIVEFRRIPEVLELIVGSAFGTHAAFGGIVGLAIKHGFDRGVSTNEAGQGSGPHAAATAQVDHPVQQGLAEAFSVLFVTLCICTATGFIVLLTGKYNVTDGKNGFLVQNLPGLSDRYSIFTSAMDSMAGGMGNIALLFVVLFCFTTMISYAYYAEANLAFLCRGRRVRLPKTFLRMAILMMIVLGCFHPEFFFWDFMDAGAGILTWINIFAILLLTPVAMNVLKDYELRVKLFESLSFDPVRLGIRGAEAWTEVEKVPSRACCEPPSPGAGLTDAKRIS